MKLCSSHPYAMSLDRYGKDPIFGATESTPGFPYLRKAHCMFGWDWGPRLPDAGIWRGIGLVCIDEARLNGVLITQHHDEHGVRLQIDPEIGMSTAGDCEYSVTARTERKRTAACMAARTAAR